MKTGDHRPSRRSRILQGLVLAGAALSLIAGDAEAGAKSKKMSRQIELFERIVDQMLVDSPNWLVQSREETRGTYVDGHGAVFTFDASLVGAGWGKGIEKKIWKMLGDEHVFLLGDEDEEEEELQEEKLKWREKDLKRQARRYERGKVEIVELLADFGDVLTTLGDGEWLEIEASLDDASYFEENELRRLTLKVKMSDVRAFADERIDEKAFVGKIQTQET